jgi:hypothetical protein
MSLIQSAKLNGHDPQSVSKGRVFTRLPTQPTNRFEQLLPNRWRQSPGLNRDVRSSWDDGALTYEVAVGCALQRACHAAATVNRRQARDFAKAIGQLGKTERLRNRQSNSRPRSSNLESRRRRYQRVNAGYAKRSNLKQVMWFAPDNAIDFATGGSVGDLLSITSVSLSTIRLEPGAPNDRRLAHKLLGISR